MTTEDARRVYSEITIEWHRSKMRGPGSKREVAFRYWSDNKIAQPFEDWFREMVYMVSKDRKDNNVKRNGANGTDPRPYKERYRQMALKLNKIPSDAQLSIAWGADVTNTLSGVRSRLKLEDGFVFEKTDDGEYLVKGRPAPPTPRLAAGSFSAVEGLQSDEATSDPGEKTRDVLRPGFARLQISAN